MSAPVIFKAQLLNSSNAVDTSAPQMILDMAALIPTAGQPQPIVAFQQFTDAAGNKQYVVASAPVSGAGGSAGAQCFRVKAEYGDVLKCVTWNGTSEGAIILQSAIVAAGGTGYTVGDILTVVGGTGTAGSLKVTSIGSGGSVTGTSVNSPGSYTAAPSSPASVTGGTGSGATFTLTADAYVFIAKPWKLRRSGTTTTIYGTAWTYTFAGSYNTSSPVIRTASASGIVIQEAISPPYLVNDVIYAIPFQSFNVTDYDLELTGAALGHTGATLIDSNMDGRAWAAVSS
jgi:hypothetical protein